MFDGELPAAECELLSRRLARDEQLRAVWSRYSVIGAVLRAEQVAQVRPDFARRVSAALASGAGLASGRRGRLWRGAALGSAIAAGVAGAAIMLLRSGLPQPQEAKVMPADLQKVWDDLAAPDATAEYRQRERRAGELRRAARQYGQQSGCAGRARRLRRPAQRGVLAPGAAEPAVRTDRHGVGAAGAILALHRPGAGCGAGPWRGPGRWATLG
jgi:hypothetical protein